MVLHWKKADCFGKIIFSSPHRTDWEFHQPARSLFMFQTHKSHDFPAHTSTSRVSYCCRSFRSPCRPKKEINFLFGRRSSHVKKWRFFIVVVVFVMFFWGGRKCQTRRCWTVRPSVNCVPEQTWFCPFPLLASKNRNLFFSPVGRGQRCGCFVFSFLVWKYTERKWRTDGPVSVSTLVQFTSMVLIFKASMRKCFIQSDRGEVTVVWMKWDKPVFCCAHLDHCDLSYILVTLFHLIFIYHFYFVFCIISVFLPW